MANVVLYTSSIAFSSKTRSNTNSLKYILQSKGVQYDEVDLSVDSQKMEDMVKASGGSKVLPQLHVDGKLVGGYDDVQEMEDVGELSKALGLAS